MLRVLRVAQTDSVLWQHALLTSEVERVLGSAAADAGGEGGEQGESQDLLASAGVRSAYRAAAVRPGRLCTVRTLFGRWWIHCRKAPFMCELLRLAAICAGQCLCL